MVSSSGAVPLQALRHRDGAVVAVHEPKSGCDCKGSDATLAHSSADEVYAVLEQTRPILLLQPQQVDRLRQAQRRVEYVHGSKVQGGVGRIL